MLTASSSAATQQYPYHLTIGQTLIKQPIRQSLGYVNAAWDALGERCERSSFDGTRRTESYVLDVKRGSRNRSGDLDRSTARIPSALVILMLRVNNCCCDIIAV